MSSRWAAIGIIAAALAALSCLAVWPAFHDPVSGRPTRSTTRHGCSSCAATTTTRVDKIFEGPLSAELRARDPHHTGNTTWVDYNEPFYERRVAVPLAGAALYPRDRGDRSLLDLSLAGYVAALLALFGLLLLRFRHRGRRDGRSRCWLLPPLDAPLVVPADGQLGSRPRDRSPSAPRSSRSTAGSGGCRSGSARSCCSHSRETACGSRSLRSAGALCAAAIARRSVTLFATGVAAALPALLLFTAPVRDLLALLVNDSELPSDTSWAFIASHYPGALVELIRANVGFLRRGEWYTALYPRRRRAALLLLVVASARGPRITTTHADDRRRGARARLRPCGARLQRVPARARLRADGRVRACPRDRSACWRARLGRAAERLRPCEQALPATLVRALDSWIGRSELPALVRCRCRDAG